MRMGLSVWVLLLLTAMGPSEAYVGVQWPLQVILGDANDYIFGIGATIVDGWSTALGSLYAASAELDVCQQCNGTMLATLTGSLGRYTYSASSVATAVVVYPKSLSSDNYIATLNGGTGLAPVVCAYNASVGDSSAFLCNIMASTGTLQVPDLLSSITGTANVSSAGFGASPFAGTQLVVASPLTFTQLSATGAGLRNLSSVNELDFGVTVQDANGLTGVTMSSFVLSDKRVLTSPPCSQSNASLLLGSVATQIVGGDAVYCYNLVNGGVVLVTAWTGTGGWSGLTPTNCSDAILAGAVTMTMMFPRNFDTTGTSPFAYALFSRGGSLQCAYGIFQASDPSGNNNNWAELAIGYNFPSLNYSTCDQDEIVEWSVPFGSGYLNYSITPCGMPGGSCDMSGSELYVNNDNQPLAGSLLLAPNNGSAALIGPGTPADTCLWLQVPPSSGVIGDGSQALASGVIGRATSLMYNSAQGLNHQSAISAGIANIEANIGSLTIFNSLSAGMSAIATGAGVNAFQRPAFLAQYHGLYRIFPLLASIAEAGFVNLATFTYAVALAHKGTSSQSVSWFDVDRNGGADYNTIDVFVATDLTLTGSANFHALQWVVLCLSMLLSAALVMYRWHFRPGRANPFIMHVPDLEGAPSSDYFGVRPRNMPYSDAMESKASVGSLGSAGSLGLNAVYPPTGPQNVQLAARR